MLEAYSTIGFLAGVTERIRLGALVGCAMHREPGVLIKAVTTLDVLSGGRVYFTIGAGWYEREARGLGIDWPERRERFERVEEILRLAHQTWDDDPSPCATSSSWAVTSSRPSPSCAKRLEPLQGAYDRLDRSRLGPPPLRPLRIGSN